MPAVVKGLAQPTYKMSDSFMFTPHTEILLTYIVRGRLSVQDAMQNCPQRGQAKVQQVLITMYLLKTVSLVVLYCLFGRQLHFDHQKLQP